MDGGAVVGAICLLAGLALIALGVYLGLKLQLSTTAGGARETLDHARKNIEDASARIDKVKGVFERGSFEAGATTDVAAQATQAAESTQRAKSAIEQVSSIIGSLPENMRFAGVLVLVGTLLVGVSTIQFGGTSLF